MTYENDVLTFDMMKEAFHNLEKVNKEPKWVMVMPEYAEKAREIATQLGYPNVKIVRSDTGEEVHFDL